MKRSIRQDGAVPSTSRGGRFTATQVLTFLDSDNENELIHNVDYPSDDMTSSSDSDSDGDVGDRGGNGGGGDAPPPRQRRRQAEDDVSSTSLDDGWSKTSFTCVDTTYANVGDAGPRNMPQHITAQSKAEDYLALFLDNDFWELLCMQKNLRARQDKEAKPTAYYAKSFKAIEQHEMKAFVALRLQMENSVIKPRYEDYWRGPGKNFISCTTGFREVMDRDRFLGIWTYLHLVDEQDDSVDKTDKIYKVRPMLQMMLPKFRHYFVPKQHLSLDEGMIPTKNRLAIKQYLKDKPTKWGIKSFLLCESDTGYIMHAEIYTGKHDGLRIDELGATGSVVIRLALAADLSQKNHILVMDRFYNSVKLFYYLHNTMGVFAMGTGMCNRKHYPKSMKQTKKTLTARGQHDYLSRKNISAIVWMDRKPINFLSSYHNPTKVGNVKRRNKDGTAVMIPIPQLVLDYNKYMGGCDKNDQIARLHKTRRHYRWPRRLFVKFVMWACYNAYVLMNFYSPHTVAGKRFRTFNYFIDELCLQLIGDFRSAVKRRESREAELPQRMQNVGLHYPARSPEATGSNVCVVCTYNYNKYRKANPAAAAKDLLYKKVTTTFWCGYCRRYLCIRDGSTCWSDWHNKREYWH